MSAELPLGFGMALAQNEAAMHRFENLSETEKQSILDQVHNVHSKAEMRRLVSDLSACTEQRKSE